MGGVAGAGRDGGWAQVWGAGPAARGRGAAAHFSSLTLHMTSSFQFTNIVAPSFSVSSSDSIRGF